MTEPGNSKARPYRPPIGIPTHGEPRAQATAAAIAFHVLVILLVLAPAIFVSNQLIEFTQRGAGGPGPVGGGGGGSQSFPGRIKYVPERVDFMKLEKAAPKLEVVTPKPEVAKPPPPPPTPEPPVAVAKDSAASAVRVDSTSVLVGAGRGTGTDGTAGSGPGRGGGVGSGVGTGRGSATGPGTGGGDGTIYPPQVVSIAMLPLPIPAGVRPYRMVAQFEVDSTGNARLLGFNPSRNSGYNRRVREMLLEIRFRPAVTMDGRPVKAIAQVSFDAM